MSKSKLWTDSEIQILKEKYPTCGSNIPELKKSVKAIRRKAEKLNIRTTRHLKSGKALPKTDHIGETLMMNCGLNATITEYINANNMTVQFETGEIRENVRYWNFTEKKILPSKSWKPSAKSDPDETVSKDDNSDIENDAKEEKSLSKVLNTLRDLERRRHRYPRFEEIPKSDDLKNPYMKMSYCKQGVRMYVEGYERKRKSIYCKYLIFDDGAIYVSERGIDPEKFNSGDIKHPHFNRKNNTFAGFITRKAFTEPNGEVYYIAQCGDCDCYDILTPHDMLKHRKSCHDKSTFIYKRPSITKAEPIADTVVEEVTPIDPVDELESETNRIIEDPAIPETDTITGVYEPTGETVEFKKVWCDHTFTTQEIYTLLHGEAILIAYLTGSGSIDRVKGELTKQKYKGQSYWGFKPIFEIPPVWCGHQFTSDEIIRLLAGEIVEINDFKSKKTDRSFSAKITVKEDENGVKRLISHIETSDKPMSKYYLVSVKGTATYARPYYDENKKYMCKTYKYQVEASQLIYAEDAPSATVAMYETMDLFKNMPQEHTNDMIEKVDPKIIRNMKTKRLTLPEYEQMKQFFNEQQNLLSRVYIKRISDDTELKTIPQYDFNLLHNTKSLLGSFYSFV